MIWFKLNVNAGRTEKLIFALQINQRSTGILHSLGHKNFGRLWHNSDTATTTSVLEQRISALDGEMFVCL